MKSANSIHVIFYSSSANPDGDRLQRIIGMLFTREQLETYRTIEALTQRLHKPMNDPLIFVILASTPDELNKMTQLRQPLQDRRIILIIPDSDPDSIAKGHSLRPRFLTYADADFVEILGVLGKMAGTCGHAGYSNKNIPVHYARR